MLGPEPTGLRMLGMRIRYKPTGRWEGPKAKARCSDLGISPALSLHAGQGWWDSWCLRIVATQFPWGRGDKNTTKTSAQNAHSSGCSQSRLLRVLVSWVFQDTRGQVFNLCSQASGLSRHQWAPTGIPCSFINRMPKA